MAIASRRDVPLFRDDRAGWQSFIVSSISPLVFCVYDYIAGSSSRQLAPTFQTYESVIL